MNGLVEAPPPVSIRRSAQRTSGSSIHLVSSTSATGSAQRGRHRGPHHAPVSTPARKTRRCVRRALRPHRPGRAIRSVRALPRSELVVSPAGHRTAVDQDAAETGRPGRTGRDLRERTDEEARRRCCRRRTEPAARNHRAGWTPVGVGFGVDHPANGELCLAWCSAPSSPNATAAGGRAPSALMPNPGSGRPARMRSFGWFVRLEVRARGSGQLGPLKAMPCSVLVGPTVDSWSSS
jgi:hypothetical protein